MSCLSLVDLHQIIAMIVIITTANATTSKGADIPVTNIIVNFFSVGGFEETFVGLLVSGVVSGIVAILSPVYNDYSIRSGTAIKLR